MYIDWSIYSVYLCIYLSIQQVHTQSSVKCTNEQEALSLFKITNAQVADGEVAREKAEISM